MIVRKVQELRAKIWGVYQEEKIEISKLSISDIIELEHRSGEIKASSIYDYTERVAATMIHAACHFELQNRNEKIDDVTLVNGS